jgi:hypothetical protein
LRIWRQNIRKQFSQKFYVGSKNAKFDADFESLELWGEELNRKSKKFFVIFIEIEISI